MKYLIILYLAFLFLSMVIITLPSILTDFKWYRKWKGGNWYYFVYEYEVDEETGEKVYFAKWSQIRPKDELIIEKELYQ